MSNSCKSYLVKASVISAGFEVSLLCSTIVHYFFSIIIII